MNNPIEPSAAIREIAHNVREMFIALVAEGFSEQQALVIIATMLKSGGGE